MWLQSLFVVSTLSWVRCNPEMDAFKWHSVVPDVLAVIPQKTLRITYDDRLLVTNGDIVTPTQVKNPPKVEWTADPDTNYTLIMIDPDAPSRQNPKNREFKHWLVANIPGNNLSKGDELTQYVGAGPPQDTGLHRYVFLLYMQKKKVTAAGNHVSNKSRRGRPKFHAKQFAEHHRLGNPVAAAFFLAEYDEYVPILHEQLSSDKK